MGFSIILYVECTYIAIGSYSYTVHVMCVGSHVHYSTFFLYICACMCGFRCVGEVSPEELTAWLEAKLPRLECVRAEEVTVGPKACSVYSLTFLVCLHA